MVVVVVVERRVVLALSCYDALRVTVSLDSSLCSRALPSGGYRRV